MLLRWGEGFEIDSFVYFSRGLLFRIMRMVVKDEKSMRCDAVGCWVLFPRKKGGRESRCVVMMRLVVPKEEGGQRETHS